MLPLHRIRIRITCKRTIAEKLEELSFDFAEFWECHVVEYPIHWLLDGPPQQANFPTALLCCKGLQRIF